MNLTAAPLGSATYAVVPVADTGDDGVLIELFDQWTGGATAPGAVFTCWSLMDQVI